MVDKPIKVNRDGKHPPEGYKMRIIPPSGKSPYTRDQLIEITVKMLTDMNDNSRKDMAIFITDLVLKSKPK